MKNVSLKKSLLSLVVCVLTLGFIGCGVPTPIVVNSGGDDPFGMGPKLCNAIQAGKTSEASDLLSKGAPLNFRNVPDGWTPLIYAIYYKNESAYTMLLDVKANTNLADYNGKTPLMQAAVQGNLELLKRLVDMNANIHAKDSDNRTALDYASINNRDECVLFLTKYARR